LFKNITVKEIAIILSCFLGGLNIIIIFALYISDFTLFEKGWFWIGLLLISVISSYYVVLFFFEKFVFRKIKLIYKVINNSKVSLPQEKSRVISNLSLEDVNQEVQEWADKTESEINYLKDLEDYRRKFLGNVSHELKTPIFTIQGYLHTLLDGALYDEKINTKYIERAVINVERLQNVVEDLEIINKLEHGGGNINKSDFNFKQLTLEVIEDLSLLAKSKNIDIKLKDGASKAFMVNADRANIEQVMTNLVSNSIKYGTEGGLTKIAFYDMAENVLIEVSDNGIGIEEEHHKHLFDRFYRVDAVRSRSLGGSGLGLSIVKHILEAHRQSINVRSTKGQGSTFGFTLTKSQK